MGKKRNEVKLITLTVEKPEVSDKPKCFGSKECYCIRELCGKWFDTCTESEES